MANQNITLDRIPRVASNGELLFSVNYFNDAENFSNNFYNLRLFYDSQTITVEGNEVEQLVFEQAVANEAVEAFLQPITAGDDVNDADNNPQTDKLIIVSFANLSGNPNNPFPGTETVEPLVTFEFQQLLGVGEDPIITFQNQLPAGDTGTVPNNGEPITIVQNTAPVAVNDPAETLPDDAYTTTEDDPLTIATEAGVLINDSDEDAGDTLAVVQVNGQSVIEGQIITLESGAQLSMGLLGNFIYDPNDAFEELNDGQTDTDTFTYIASDGTENSNAATVTITIEGITDNLPPVAEDDIASTNADTILSVPIFDIDNGVFGNNILENDEDPDDDRLTVGTVEGNAANVGRQITTEEGALVTVNADGTYTYNPNGAFDELRIGESETDSFTYTAFDGLENSEEATVSINVFGTNFFENDRGLIRVEESVNLFLERSVESESTRDSLLAYYLVDDEEGRIDGLEPDEEGYAAKAILRAEETDFIVQGGIGGNTASGAVAASIDAGFYAPMAIINGGRLDKFSDFLEINAENKTDGDIARVVAYFAFDGANPDKTRHFIADRQTLGLEDWFGGGDDDFNDIELALGLG